MQLSKYLRNIVKMNARQWALEVGLCIPTVYAWLQGRQVPNLPNALLIEKLTSGHVCPEDWDGKPD